MSGINLLTALTDNIAVDRNKCVACGICVEKCPMDNLRLKLSPCRQACPLGVNCQGYVNLIARGAEEQALALVRETLPFPGILGRVCSQPCEKNCHHTALGSSSIAIRALKRYLADRFAEEATLPDAAPASGRTAAIIGAGPAGLMAAYDLAVRGHQVCVFDAQPQPGGMLRWAIPAFRLPEAVLQREIGRLERLGVAFVCNAPMDNAGVTALRHAFGAVIIATGSPGHRKLGLAGEDLPGVYHALPFLKAVRAGNAPMAGKRTVVIGGGNAAVDAAQSALRLGADSVTMVCLEAENEMPAFPWALAGARDEGITVASSLGPVRFLSEGGALCGVAFVKCTSVYDASGRFSPCFDACQTATMEADTVIIAAGQAPATQPFEGLGIIADGRLAYDAQTLATPAEGLFCAGDAAHGPTSVVEAMASGRRAAESVHRYLMGEDMRYGRDYQGPVETAFDIATRDVMQRERVIVPVRIGTGTGDFGEIEAGLGEDAARKEAQRCFACGQAFGAYRTCWFCLPCEIECPHEALKVEIPYLLR